MRYQPDAKTAEPTPPETTVDAGTASPETAPAKAPAVRATPDKIESTLRPIRMDEFGYDQARHLLWRAGFGGTPQQIETLASWGPEKAVDYILGYDKVEFEAPAADKFDKDIMRPPTEEERRMVTEARRRQDEETLAKAQLERQRREREDRRQVGEMQKWWLKRMVETPRPLEEKMTLFWHGHFATNYRTIENSYHVYLQNQLFRKHAIGSFADLMFGIIRDPAMIAYLDNNDSRKNRPNENLAREIMELFALGLGNYTEQDIKEGARALTGYTFNDDEFVLQQNNHDTGAKTILGRKGNWDGDDFVRIILEQPACAHFIARKVYHYLVADVPPDERGGDKSMPGPQRQAIRQMADALRSSRYQMRPMLRRLFLSDHFYSVRFMNDQVKSPASLVVGAIRSLGAPARDLTILADAMDLMGQNIFYPPSVKGWEGGRAWINTSTLFVRQNLLAFLLTGKRTQGYDPTAETMKYDPLPLIAHLDEREGQAARNPGAIVEALMKLALGTTPAHAREPLISFFASNGNRVTRENVTGLLLLLTAMPEYQLC